MSGEFDIVVLGGGLVGCSLACALQGSGYRVALLEASAAQATPPGFDERKLALAAASLNALNALGVLARLVTPPAPIRRLHVSRQGDFGVVRLAAADYGRSAFGGVVLARELGQALEARVNEVPEVRRFRPARVVAVARDARGWPQVRAETAEGEVRLTARLLVAADGTRSLARDAMGIATLQHDYRQTLFVCTVATDQPADGTAYERFTGQGPVALLPMAGGGYGGICAVAREDAAAVSALDDAAWAGYFQQRFGWRAGRIRKVGARSAYPLIRTVAERLDAPRFLVMGNAAQTIHPIGAQGFNLGLRDALSLAECLAGSRSESITCGDPGRPDRLAAYVAARAEDRQRTLAFSDGLARFTATPGLLAHTLRSVGLSTLGQLPGMAGPLVSGAMGFRGQVPELSRSGLSRSGLSRSGS